MCLLFPSSPLSSIDIDSVEIGTLATRPARSTPMNMPLTTGGRSLVPVLIESSSCSKYFVLITLLLV